MKLIPLTKGYSAMVDDADVDWLNQWKWHAHESRNTIYARTNVRDSNGNRGTLLMHRQILGLTNPEVFGEHEDGNGLNNTRKNLRPCTHAENNRNCNSFCGSSSFKGVFRHKLTNSWQSQITVNRKRFHIGIFRNEEDAARAYNQQARERHGAFAKYNNVSTMFPDEEWTPRVLISSNASGFRGVHFDKRRKKWASQIVVRGKHIHLGYFTRPEEAALSYDNAATRAFGDTAKLNFHVPDANGPAFKSALEKIWAENEGDLDETKIETI